MPHVYILNDGGHDYSDAARYGELVFCTRGPLDRWDTSQMWRSVTVAMDGSTPEDYILLTSLSTLCAIGSAVFAQKHGRLNLLLFRDEKYLDRTLLLTPVVGNVAGDEERQPERNDNATIFPTPEQHHHTPKANFYRKRVHRSGKLPR